MLEAFSREELDAVVRLRSNDDFKILTEFIVKSVTGLALTAAHIAGMESEKIKGGCLALEELRDQMIFAPDVLNRQLENEELAGDGRDTISP